LSLGLDDVPASPAASLLASEAAALGAYVTVIMNTSTKVAKATLSGQKLWYALGQQKNGEALQNAFVNVTDILGSIRLENSNPEGPYMGAH
jgi:hypothetical protein